MIKSYFILFAYLNWSIFCINSIPNGKPCRYAGKIETVDLNNETGRLFSTTIFELGRFHVNPMVDFCKVENTKLSIEGRVGDEFGLGFINDIMVDDFTPDSGVVILKAFKNQNNTFVVCDTLSITNETGFFSITIEMATNVYIVFTDGNKYGAAIKVSDFKN